MQIKFSKKTAISIAQTLLVVLMTTIISFLLLPILGHRSIGMIFLLSIHIGTLFIKDFHPFLSAILSGILWNFLYIPSRFTFKIASTDDWLMLGVFLITSLIVGHYTNKIKNNQKKLKEEIKKNESLCHATFLSSYSKNLTDMVNGILKEMTSFLKLPVDIQIPGQFDNNNNGQNYLQFPIDSSNTHYGYLSVKTTEANPLKADQEKYIKTMTTYLANYLNKESLLQELKQKEIDNVSELIYKTILSSISHELKTPISIIKGFFSALTQVDSKIDKLNRTDTIEEINAGIQRLETVVENLLSMGRIESGRLMLNLDLTDLVEIIYSSYQKVKAILGDRSFDFKYDPNIPLLNLDQFLIAQVFENIFRNACLYTPDNSTITVRIREANKEIITTIIDNGPGLGENPDKIFKKFYRNRPQIAGGLGLGLSISKAIVELHGGKIYADNQKNLGAKFTIILPTSDNIYEENTSN